MTVGSLSFLLCLRVLSAIYTMLPSVRSRQFVLWACNLTSLTTSIHDAANWFVLRQFAVSRR